MFYELSFLRYPCTLDWIVTCLFHSICDDWFVSGYYELRVVVWFK